MSLSCRPLVRRWLRSSDCTNLVLIAVKKQPALPPGVVIRNSDVVFIPLRGYAKMMLALDFFVICIGFAICIGGAVLVACSEEKKL